MILFGLKSTGKSYFGQKFAALASLPFIDTDLLIGTPFCRQKEDAVIAALKPGAIHAFGGGAMLNPKNRRLDLGPLVYLTIDREILRERHRVRPPSFDFEAVYEERKAIYDNIPAHRIELTGRQDEEILQELWVLYTNDLKTRNFLGSL